MKYFHNLKVACCTYDLNTANAKEVKEGFLSDVLSDAAQKVDKELRHLHLPTLPEIKDDFMKLCDKIGV